jgi:beta-glucanase (GH16 family)
MRAKFDADDGLWPAFWTLGENGQWPSNGEIDIMEYYKKNLLANIACGTEKQYVAKWFSNKRPLSSFKGKSWNKKFHIWRMDWDENSIKLYVDDTLMNSVPLSKLVNPDGTNPFKQKQYILLDLALGGDNGGPINGTKFPKSFVIDYVRVYQKE